MNENMLNIKEKLRNVLHSGQFCGICLENDDNNNMSTIDEVIEIIVNQQVRTNPLSAMINVVFNQGENFLAHTQICNSCTEKLIQAYIFIENAKETFKIIDNYVNDLFKKSDEIYQHLPDSQIESSNVVIVLDNVLEPTAEKERIDILKHDINKVPENKNEFQEVKKETPKTKYSKFKCTKCLVKLPSYRALKLHRYTCMKQKIECKICFKRFRNQQYLNSHYKVHASLRCKICHKILHEEELLEHLKIKHIDSLHTCSQCNEVFYTLNTLQTHEKICHKIKGENPHCLMCLKTFTKEELKLHNCKYNCPECSEVPCMHYKYLMFYREQILNRAGKAKCLDCDYVCRRKEILLGHVNREHLDHHPFTCDKCGQQFYSKIVLTSHIHKFHEDFFVCRFCDSEFSNINTYTQHVEACEDIERSFVCDECPASFDSSDNLTKHIKCRHSTDVFPCGLCNKKFLKDSKRKEHMVKVHSGLQSKNKVINVQCVVCQETFDTKGELVQHMRSHGPNTTYPCRICNTEYETLRQFRAHYRKHNGPFATCHICGKEMREILLKKHLTTHTNSIETCETCGRSFPNIALLKSHQKVHLENVPCPKCNKMINPARLRRHWRRHLMEENPGNTGIKKQQPNLKCERCDYKTWNNTLLECHMNRHHLKIKPYVCHICSKDFIGKHLLKKHIETHNMKSVMCMVCLKSFANSACLKMHLRLHTGEKPFTCEICGDRFRSSSIMNVHKLKKHSDKSNSCPLCSNKFHTVRDLRRHVIKVHWKQKDKRFDPREMKGLDKEHYHLFHDGRRVKVAEEDVDIYMPCSL
ncbi:zinc finger protein 11-like [Helicoverpa zea]|uniref:zinc finger protein 11-like n=1 Tax=Helicoverpa zea TaxID=7113 RepID=UPI001F56A943|nr:zinc finger protein 11-like [Helicoverpa zea]XP_047037914.1 zinc finger protein 11-like [Helicoverpa zea]XP_047037915.1 zinc finger protein 11-like [Helicoverpa zea]